MKLALVSIPIVVLSAVLVAASPGSCGGGAAASVSLANGSGSGGSMSDAETARAVLQGFREVPAISTTGHGTFRATRSADGTSFEFELTYADLEGNTGDGGAVTGAHVHFGQPGVAGGIAVHLCGTGGRAACPAPPATVTGTFTAADVVGPTAQGIDAGQLDELLRAARAGLTYVNVHTTRFPTGEIRGQIRLRGGDQDGDRDDDD